MRTAMQELIDEMNEMLIDGNGSIYVLKEQARKLLKKEKEQIMDAYDAGQLHFWPEEFLQRGEYYYNETFNTNEK